MELQKRRKRRTPIEVALSWKDNPSDPEGFEVGHFDKKGCCIVTVDPRHKGDFLLVYKGETLPQEEAEARESKHSSGFRYFFRYKNKMICIDATEENKSLGRLVNHGEKRDRNAVLKMINGQLYLFCLRDIESGVETLYDYGITNLPWKTCEKFEDLQVTERSHVKHDSSDSSDGEDDADPEKYEQRHDARAFESRSIIPEEGVRSEDAIEDVKPDTGSAKKAIEVFEEMQKISSKRQKHTDKNVAVVRPCPGILEDNDIDYDDDKDDDISCYSDSNDSYQPSESVQSSEYDSDESDRSITIPYQGSWHLTDIRQTNTADAHDHCLKERESSMDESGCIVEQQIDTEEILDDKACHASYFKKITVDTYCANEGKRNYRKSDYCLFCCRKYE